MVTKLVVRQCLRSADAIACVSESTRERLGHWLGKDFADRAVAILNAAEPVSVACAKSPQALRMCRSFVLCIAQHRRNKNIALALEIFDRMLRTGIVSSETDLVIIGVPGPETTQIERQIRRLRLERQIVLLSGILRFRIAVVLSKLQATACALDRRRFWSTGLQSPPCRVVCSDIPAFREVGESRAGMLLLGRRS